MIAMFRESTRESVEGFVSADASVDQNQFARINEKGIVVFLKVRVGHSDWNDVRCSHNVFKLISS